MPGAGSSAETVLARPLFTPGRRPPTPGQVAVGPAPAADKGLPRMTGILIDGESRRAIFVGPEGGRPVVVAEGGRVGGFVVQKIDPQSVTVSGLTARGRCGRRSTPTAAARASCRCPRVGRARRRSSANADAAGRAMRRAAFLLLLACLAGCEKQAEPVGSTRCRSFAPRPGWLRRA